MINHPKYNRGNIYLSGGMQFSPDLGGKWRELCAQRLTEMKYFPIDITALDKAYTAEHGELYLMTDKKNHLQYRSNMRKHFIYTDIQLIEKDSDAIIVYYDESVRRGAGTISECQVAFNNDIPIFLVSAYEDWANEVPGWLLGLTTKFFLSFEDLYNYLDRLPEGILKRDAYGNHSSGNQYLCSLCGNTFDKDKHHFVSKVSPLYCKSCVELVTRTFEGCTDRYEFCINQLQTMHEEEVVSCKGDEIR